MRTQSQTDITQTISGVNKPITAVHQVFVNHAERYQRSAIQAFAVSREVPTESWIHQTRDICTGKPTDEIRHLEAEDGETFAAFYERVRRVALLSEATCYYVMHQEGSAARLLQYDELQETLRSWTARIRLGRIGRFTLDVHR